MGRSVVCHQASDICSRGSFRPGRRRRAEGMIAFLCLIAALLETGSSQEPALIFARPTTWSQEGSYPSSGFGGWIASAGDVNGDKFADVLIAAPNADSNRGQVFLYLGSAQGLATPPAWVARGESAGAWFGNRAEGIGDVNGDGFGDVIIGAPLQDVAGARRVGRACIFFGSAKGLGSQPGWTFSGTHEEEQLGGLVQAVGDVNGDGRPDFAIFANPLSAGGPLEESWFSTVHHPAQH